MKYKYGVALLLAALLAPFAGIARALMPAGKDALNVQGTHEGPVTYRAEGALAANLVVTFGTAPVEEVKVCTAALRPIGVTNDDALDNANVAVELLLTGGTRLVTASKAIAAGVRVYATAGGKVTDAVVQNAYLVGEALTAAAGDGSVFEIMPLSPVINP
jgi:hypothetical protein